LEAFYVHNIDKALKHCAEAPAFGPPEAATGNATGIQSQGALLGDVFGPDTEDAIAHEADAKDAAKCQQAVYKAVDGCQRSKLVGAGRCIKKGLKDGSVVGKPGLVAARGFTRHARLRSAELRWPRARRQPRRRFPLRGPCRRLPLNEDPDCCGRRRRDPSRRASG